MKLSELTVDGRGHYGIGASAVEKSDELYAYLRITDIYDDGTLNKAGLKSVDDPDAEKYLLKPNDIVFARTGNSVGKSYFYDERDGSFVYAGFLIKFSLDPAKVNPRFVKYYCQSQRYKNWVASFSTGSTRGNINAQTYGDMEILTPCRAQQDFLVEILSALDDKIELNRRINANLEQQAAAIFKAWFVDAPEADGWKKGTFADLIEKIVSGDWGKETPSGNNVEMVYCIRGTDIPEVRAGNKGKMPTRYILPKNYAAKQLTDGDIVVEISGGSPTQSTGRAAVISSALLNRYDKGMVCTNFCKALKPAPGYSMFTYYYWQYLYANNVFFAYENGTTGIKNLDISGFIETEPIVVAPRELVARFETLCREYFATIYANGLEIEKLAAVRDALLPRLMSGEIDVSDVSL